MYKLISSISVIIRLFYLPNPFEKLEYSIMINYIAEPFLHILTLGVVQLFYRYRSAPAWGSFLYLFFYWLHTYILVLCGQFSFNEIACIIIVILYIAILILIKNKLLSKWSNRI